MSRKKRPTLANLKAEVWAELKRGEDIIETELVDPKDKYYGLCVDDKRVYVNPIPSIVETLCHELIHRKHGRLSEARVTALAQRLVQRMTNAELRRFAKQYRAVARKRRKPLQVDDAA